MSVIPAGILGPLFGKLLFCPIALLCFSPTGAPGQKNIPNPSGCPLPPRLAAPLSSLHPELPTEMNHVDNHLGRRSELLPFSSAFLPTLSLTHTRCALGGAPTPSQLCREGTAPLPLFPNLQHSLRCAHVAACVLKDGLWGRTLHELISALAKSRCGYIARQPGPFLCPGLSLAQRSSLPAPITLVSPTLLSPHPSLPIPLSLPTSLQKWGGCTP